MKRVFIAFIICTSLLSCKKDNSKCYLCKDPAGNSLGESCGTKDEVKSQYPFITSNDDFVKYCTEK